MPGREKHKQGRTRTRTRSRTRTGSCHDRDEARRGLTMLSMLSEASEQLLDSSV